jgi:hypothetical protein
LSRAIRQAILLVPTSSAATSAERLGDSGFIFGVRPTGGSSCVASLLLRLLVLERSRGLRAPSDSRTSRGRAAAGRSR